MPGFRLSFLEYQIKLFLHSHENLSKLLRHEMSDFVNYALDCMLVSDEAQRKVAVADFLRRHDQILLALAMSEGGAAAAKPFSERSVVEEAMKAKATNGAAVIGTDCVEELEEAELL